METAVVVDATTEYARAVVEEREPAGRWVRLAAERHLRDLERQGTDDFPYVFDVEKAQRVLDFFPFCRHVKGPMGGQPIYPEPFQAFIFGSIFGWVHRDTGLRRFRKAYTQVARGNAKSTSLSVLGLYMMVADGEMGAEIYATATKRDQARIVYDSARRMVLNSPDLAARIRAGRSEMEHDVSGAKFRTLSKDDYKTGDGLAPHLGIVDEYHAHPTAEMYEVLNSAMTKRTQPLLFIITTAGDDINSPCYREYRYCTRLLEGAVTNEEYFVYIAQLDEGDDWRDESTWIKANPLVAKTDWGMRSLRADFQEALDDPHKLRNFLIKNLNMWVDQREEGYMPMDRWNACATSDDNPMPDLDGRECCIGVDLSAKIDLTSVAVEFPLEDGRVAILSHSFMPEETIDQRRKEDKVHYDLWVQQGWITPIPGAVVDHNVIADWIDEQVEAHGWQVREVAIDPYLASQFGLELQRRGYVVVEVPQSIRHLSVPTKDILERTLSKRLIHDGSPVMAWAMGNAIVRSDAQGNIMLDKRKSRERIDPAAALMTCHARAMHADVGVVDVSEFVDDDFLDRLWG